MKRVRCDPLRYFVEPSCWRSATRHPQLDLLAAPRIVNLSRREASIVITLERPARRIRGPSHLWAAGRI